MNRVKRISLQILQKHRDLFCDDFQKNKEALTQVAIIRSKQLRNEVAGYITSYLRADSNDEAREEEVTETGE